MEGHSEKHKQGSVSLCKPCGSSLCAGTKTKDWWVQFSLWILRPQPRAAGVSMQTAEKELGHLDHSSSPPSLHCGQLVSCGLFLQVSRESAVVTLIGNGSGKATLSESVCVYILFTATAKAQRL